MAHTAPSTDAMIVASFAGDQDRVTLPRELTPRTREQAYEGFLVYGDPHVASYPGDNSPDLRWTVVRGPEVMGR